MRHLTKLTLMTTVLLLQGTVGFSIAADDGVVILQREVSPRPAYRQMPPGRTSEIDVSPDDQVRSMTGENHLGNELQDADFAKVSSGQTVMGAALGNYQDTLDLNVVHGIGRGLGNGAGNTTNAPQSIVPVVSGAVGPSVGALNGHVGAGVKGVTGTLNNLTGTLTRTGAP